MNSNDIGRGFKLNRKSGEDTFKSKAFNGKMERGPMTGSSTVSTVITSIEQMQKSMEISGKLGVSYGPMISGEGSGHYIEKTMSSNRRAVLVYRTRHNAFFDRFVPDTLEPTQDVEDNLNSPDYIYDNFGTGFVDTVVYGAQLDVTFAVTSTEDIDMEELEAELKGSIGVGPLSIEFQANFEKGKSSAKALYNMAISAEASGVFVPIPANPTFEAMNDIIKNFNEKYEKKFENYREGGNPLLEQIQPVGFSVSSIADKIQRLNNMESSLLEDRMQALEEAFRRTLFWKAKLISINQDLKNRYDKDHKLRVNVYKPYAEKVRAALLGLENNLKKCIDFRARTVEEIINAPEEDVPKPYPDASSSEEDLYRGLCGEYYIASPVQIGEHAPLEDMYYTGFAIKVGNADADGIQVSTFIPWMHGTLWDNTVEAKRVIVATGETPEELYSSVSHPPPPAPSDLKQDTNHNDDSLLVISWAKPPPDAKVQSYTMTLNEHTFPDFTPKNANTPSMCFDRLKPGTKYEVFIRAKNGYGTGQLASMTAWSTNKTDTQIKTKKQRLRDLNTDKDKEILVHSKEYDNKKSDIFTCAHIKGEFKADYPISRVQKPGRCNTFVPSLLGTGGCTWRGNSQTNGRVIGKVLVFAKQGEIHRKEIDKLKKEISKLEQAAKHMNDNNDKLVSRCLQRD